MNWGRREFKIVTPEDSRVTTVWDVMPHSMADRYQGEHDITTLSLFIALVQQSFFLHDLMTFVDFRNSTLKTMLAPVCHKTWRQLSEDIDPNGQRYRVHPEQMTPRKWGRGLELQMTQAVAAGADSE
jgi:capsid protein